VTPGSRLRQLRRGLAVAGPSSGSDLDALRVQLGWLQSRAVATAEDVRDAEFKVFSQFGEDGTIQYLIQQVPILNDVFVEFGVADSASPTPVSSCSKTTGGV
jgi:hypothetical protein